MIRIMQSGPEEQENETKKFVISINAWIKVPHRRESFIEQFKNL